MSDKTNEPLNYDLILKERPVTIGGEEYMLVELDGLNRDKYLNDLGGRMRNDKDGRPRGVKNFEGLQAGLLSRSLFKLEDGEREAVKPATIQSWPASVVSGLHDAAKELSALGDEDDEDDEGND